MWKWNKNSNFYCYPPTCWSSVLTICWSSTLKIGETRFESDYIMFKKLVERMTTLSSMFQSLVENFKRQFGLELPFFMRLYVIKSRFYHHNGATCWFFITLGYWCDILEGVNILLERIQHFLKEWGPLLSGTLRDVIIKIWNKCHSSVFFILHLEPGVLWCTWG